MSPGGLIFDPKILGPDLLGAAYPVGRVISDTKLEVYFSSRLQDNKSVILRAIFSYLRDGFQLLEVDHTPIVKPGDPGLFDSDGTSMGCLFEKGNELNILYLGWHLQLNVPWMNTIGLSKSINGGITYIKNSKVPFFGRSDEDPYSLSYPWLLKSDDYYYLFYGSNLTWAKGKADMQHGIKMAVSKNLLTWERNESFLFPLSPDCTAMSRPSVIWIGNKFLMIFSCKNSDNRYRLKLAKSKDLINWSLENIEFTSSGFWDSDEMCYGSLLMLNERIIVLYNGNGYGRTGFGYFELHNSDFI